MDLSEIKGLIEAQGKAWEEFKSTNDERIKRLEKGLGTDDLEAKLEKINGELSRVEREYKTGLTELEKLHNRPKFGNGDPETAELKAFNRAVKSHCVRLNRPLAADISPDQYAEYKTGFISYMAKGREEIPAEERKAMTIGSDPDGGYLVPAEFEAGIDSVVTRLSAMRQLARIQNIGSASYKKIVKTSGASGGWAGETESPSETNTPQLVELDFVPGKVYAEPRASSDMLEDASIDIEEWLAEEVTLTFSELEGQAFIDGDGIKKPRGFLSYPTVANASYSWGKLGFTVTGAAADFASSNPSDAIMDAIHSLKRQYRQNASFILNDATLGKIRKFKDGQGIYLWVPGLQQGQVGVLLGYPVVTDDFMPDLGAGKFPLAFGDFRRGYLIIDRRGTTVLRDPYTAKPYVKFYTTRRVGGGVQNFEAIKLLKCST